MNPRELAMAAEEARSRLGRGLASLIGDVGGEARRGRDQTAFAPNGEFDAPRGRGGR